MDASATLMDGISHAKCSRLSPWVLRCRPLAGRVLLKAPWPYAYGLDSVPGQRILFRVGVVCAFPFKHTTRTCRAFRCRTSVDQSAILHCVDVVFACHPTLD